VRNARLDENERLPRAPRARIVPLGAIVEGSAMKILLAVDGSKAALRATRFAVRMLKEMVQPQTLVLMHADVPLMRRVAAAYGPEQTRRYHEDNARVALKDARAALKRAGVQFSAKMVIGEPAASIVRTAQLGKFDLVVMGSRGRSALKTLLLGSIATKVLSHSSVPVIVVR
jgi:nucleotide-binding universal stress UspA family protein